MDGYYLVERAPTVEEYQTLCTTPGWGEADANAIRKSVQHSLYRVCVLEKGKPLCPRTFYQIGHL
ncbi:MAG: hypothetical protein NVS2B12_09010 [Ktedonobacteraceae bacterium]